MGYGMKKKSRKSGILKSFILFLVCLLVQTVVHAHEVIPVTDQNKRSTTKQLLKIIASKLDYYNKTYPEIQFIQLGGGKYWHSDMVAVLTMLGTDADALDYQHPPQLREDLLNVTLERIRRFLQADVVAASLFRTGTDSIIKRPNLCVITLNPEVFVANDYAATRYMLDLSDEEMKKVHPARYLDHIHHLEFTLDHEAFHCLDSWFNGGAPKTQKELGGEYNLFRRESIADAYAMIMHIRTHGAMTSYSRNIIHSRALWLYTDSPNRCTFETLRTIPGYDPKTIQQTPVEKLIELADHIRNKTVGDYDAYLIQRGAAVNAANELGMDVKHYGEQWAELARSESNSALIKHLVNRYKYYYEMLFTDSTIPMEAPPQREWNMNEKKN